tara:strand:+ start:377 stop:709 length:333 start_codon:yes stop_codon:yes gene_type:complete
MNKNEIISSMKLLTEQTIENKSLNFLSFYNSLRHLLKTDLLTKNDVTFVQFKHALDNVKHFIECEHCQNDIKKYVHDIDEYVNQYVTDEMMKNHHWLHVNDVSCENDTSK